MQQLEKIQQNFYEAIFDAEKAVDFVSSNYPEKRMNIYRNTVIENLRVALSLTFPKSWKLLGEDCANSVAYHFIKARNLPDTGVFDDWGADFAAFALSVEELQIVPYISDFIRYEWLSHRAYLSAGARSVDINEFSKFSAKEMENVKFKLLPSVFLYESQYPIDQINSVVSDADGTFVDLEKRGSCAIIYRPYLEVITLWISHAKYVFFKALSESMSLKEASGHLQEKELTEFLLFAMANNIIETINL